HARIELRLELEPLQGHGERGAVQVLQLQLVNAGVDQGQGEGLLQGNDVGVGVPRQPDGCRDVELGNPGNEHARELGGLLRAYGTGRAAWDDPVHLPPRLFRHLIFTRLRVQGNERTLRPLHALACLSWRRWVLGRGRLPGGPLDRPILDSLGTAGLQRLEARSRPRRWDVGLLFPGARVRQEYWRRTFGICPGIPARIPRRRSGRRLSAGRRGRRGSPGGRRPRRCRCRGWEARSPGARWRARGGASPRGEWRGGPGRL